MAELGAAGGKTGDLPNAGALDWQAKSWGWQSWEFMAACPLEGLVRRLPFLLGRQTFNGPTDLPLANRSFVSSDKVGS